MMEVKRVLKTSQMEQASLVEPDHRFFMREALNMVTQISQ